EPLFAIPVAERFPIRELRGDELPAGRAVLHRIDLEADACAWRERRRAPPRAGERVRAAAFDAPFLFHAAVLNFDLNPDMRVLPLELFDGAGNLFYLRRIEHRRRVMRRHDGGRGDEEKCSGECL